MSSTYLDSNATTPMDPGVVDVVMRYMAEEFGNAGSRTHSWGADAAKAVETARKHVAEIVDSRPDEVIFTSGATESNNLAILGLASHGQADARTHLITTAVEHKAVLEPCEHLVKEHGFDMTVLPVDDSGAPTAEALADALRPETLFVSTMHVNNETGVELPLSQYADVLDGHNAWWHVDAAQGFGKILDPLTNKRIDLMSVSSHKVYGPKGIGALVSRRRKYDRPPLRPLMFGGAQERGLRPGTLPVALIAGLGEAARLAGDQCGRRHDQNVAFRDSVLAALRPLNPLINGDTDRTVPHVLNVSFAGVDAEAAMVATKDLVAISNGSACTSNSYEPSHVLTAMGLDPDRIAGALRISWSHMTPDVDWDAVAARLANMVQ